MISSKQVIDLHQALNNGKTVMVEFLKSDGSSREMTCVNSPEVAGITDWDYKGGKSPSSGENHQVVFDVDKNEFRSFLYSTVQKWAIAK